jgi:glycosyltransferase involved in cell wall biosynthesis
MQFIRRERVRWLYLTDFAAVHPAYPALRAAGVRRIVVHDHTSGARTVPRGLRRWAKWCLARVPGLAADLVIGVSDFVVRRQIEVSQVPRERVWRVWNGVKTPDAAPEVSEVFRSLGVDESRPLIVCAARAVPEKGLDVLIQAFDRLLKNWAPTVAPPVLVHLGLGPELERLKAVIAELPSKDSIRLAGYQDDPMPFYWAATVCVQPSLWQEAFGLSVLEPMSVGCAVIATAVGGVPEIVVNGVTGVLVPPGDIKAMAEALHSLLLDPERRKALGSAGMARAASQFRREDTIAQVVGAVLDRAPRATREHPI